MKTLVTTHFFLTTLLAMKLLKVTAVSVYEVPQKLKNIFTYGDPEKAFQTYLREINKKKKTEKEAHNYKLESYDDSDKIDLEDIIIEKTDSPELSTKDDTEESMPDLRDPMIIATGLVGTLSRFDRERIPERVVHARGAGAYGTFTVARNLKKYTKAAFLHDVGKKTPVFVRFSTGTGDRGSADTRPDVRAFAIKFYTEEGNLDFIGINFPIFFTDEPSLYPTLVHAMKTDPVTNMKDPNILWDVAIKVPSMFNMFILYFSDYSTPDGYRHIDGFPIHTYELENENGDVYYAKFHFKSDQGLKNFPLKRALSLAGSDPEYSTSDLHMAISTNNYPSWTVYMQIMDLSDLQAADFNPFTLVRTWPGDTYPLMVVGRIVLDRNPSNYFEEVEQAAFCPGNLLPGILGSPDPIFQARKFSYTDSQYHRLGANFHQIHVNKPLPNPRSDGANENRIRQPTHINRLKASMRRYMKSVKKNPTRFEDAYVEARNLYMKFLVPKEREALAKNIAISLRKVETHLQFNALKIFDIINEELSSNIRHNMFTYQDI